MKRALAALVTAAVCHPVALGLPSTNDAAVLVAERKPITDPRAYVQQRAARSGWTGRQWSCLHTLLMRESSMRPTAVNGSHYGLFQEHRLPVGTPMETQVRRGLRYVAERYGTPCHALAHSFDKGWY